MTDKQTEALKLALEALERCGSESYAIEREAITAIREALAQSRSDEEQPAQQEPWEHLKAYGYAPGGYMMTCRGCNTTVIGVDKRASRCKPCAIKAFKAQQQERKTSYEELERIADDLQELCDKQAIRLGKLEAQQQEPVAWRTFDGEGGYDYRTYDMNENYAKEWDKQNPKHKGWVEPLYTSPPNVPTARASKPLTDEQLLHFVDIHVGAPSMAYPLDNSDWITFARAIEAAHGIKGDA